MEALRCGYCTHNWPEKCATHVKVEQHEVYVDYCGGKSIPEGFKEDGKVVTVFAVDRDEFYKVYFENRAEAVAFAEADNRRKLHDLAYAALRITQYGSTAYFLLSQPVRVWSELDRKIAATTKLKEAALAKLTPEEQEALGL